MKTLLALGTLALAAQVSAQVTFYEHDGFKGRSFTANQSVGDLGRSGFSDRASSVVVTSRLWKVCEDVRMGGRCTVLRPGSYASLGAMGLNDRVSSVGQLRGNERVDENAYAPRPLVEQDFRRRRDERTYEANVTSARAVVGTAAQRCWMEREQAAAAPQGNANIAGAAVGAIIGGILGHQVGGGSGKQIATVGGALGGAALGSQYGRDDRPVSTQNVRRCDDNPAQATPSYWDVTYKFRGQEHRVQMATAPGRTVTVNHKGEPRA
ncbi:MAG: glycine zipper 2TM domain-containing protein [Comamonadaceae bacterium]|nr:MAG: glycine zipper 2TM domain-containing protein [Comamonadaceae bacterium]